MTSRNLRSAGVQRLLGDTSGLALLEFALVLPVFLAMSLTGAELTNYIITRMRISQIALQLADNAARVGTGSQLQAKTISEADINDLLVGAQMQSGDLDLLQNGRVIISSLEPIANPNTTYKYRIAWQRCKGQKASHASSYGVAGDTNLDGMGAATRLAVAPEGGATMFVEVYYVYKPLIQTAVSPTPEMQEIASMMVRDRRDTSDDTKLANGNNNPNPQHPNGVYKVAGVTPSTC